MTAGPKWLNFLFWIFLGLVFGHLHIINGWQYYTSLTNLRRFNDPYNPEVIKAKFDDYIYGDCQNEHLELLTEIKLAQSELVNKIIIRNFIDVKKTPTCIRLKATGFQAEEYKPPLFHFQICVGRIAFIYGNRRYLYFYYEWFMPREVTTTDWDISFYATPGIDWIN